MDQDVMPDLESLGLAAGKEIAGTEAVKQVEVIPGVDAWYRPAYHFTYLIDRDRASLPPGLVLIRVAEKLEEELAKRGDEHWVTVRLRSRAEWDEGGHGRSV